TQFMLSLSEVGIFYILISSSATTYYNSFSEAYEIEIKKTQTVINIEEAQIPFDDSKGLVIKLVSEFGNALADQQLLVIINSTTFSPITDENGTVFIDISGFPLGNHSIFVDFAGVSNYHGIDLYANLEIIPQETQLLIIYEDNQPYLQLLDSEGRPLINRDVTFQYIDSNETVIASEDLTTDIHGMIFIDINSNDLAEDAEKLYVLFKGEKYYTACEILLIISEFIIKLQQSLNDPAFWTYSTVGLIGIAVIFGFRHFLKKRKI
ncbi:MAG: hypothetical protein ACTSQF_13295, partial [Candidatus Heimdallarchaeaceae archaeon]